MNAPLRNICSPNVGWFGKKFHPRKGFEALYQVVSGMAFAGGGYL
ncbi:hypothetical protein F01_320019 [Burkholderia cenocepacia]|nr:hypothetical protein F01_320019 [Burkholderia cenocepacia]